MNCRSTTCALRPCVSSFHLSVGGAGLRVHLSNAFGTRRRLRLTSVHIARPLSTSSPAIDPSQATGC